MTLAEKIGQLNQISPWDYNDLAGRVAAGQNLTVDLQGSCLRSRMIHEYTENGAGEYSRVHGNKYTLKFLGMYEHRSGSRSWNSGISHNSSVTHNVYSQEYMRKKADVTQSQTAIVAEYSDRWGRWGTVLNIRAAYNHMKQDNRSIDRIFLLPAVNVSYRPADNYFLRYTVSLDYVMPGVSEISAVAQPVQSGMIRRGNPALRPFHVIDQAVTASFGCRCVTVKAIAGYRNEHNPVMESVIFENGEFVRTYFNQRSFQLLRLGGTLSARPWKDHVSITAEPMLYRYFSHGIGYRHCHSIFRIGLSVDFNYGNWLAYANIMSGPENKMYGEEIIEEKDMNQIMAGYKRNGWSIHLGVFNAFMRDYWMETRNVSSLAPYRSKAHSGRSSSYMAIRFSLSLDFGRKSRQVDVPDHAADNDSGILTGTK